MDGECGSVGVSCAVKATRASFMAQWIVAHEALNIEWTAVLRS